MGTKTCLIEKCPNVACFRGLCPRCHRSARRAIAQGLASEAELVERGMLLASARGRKMEETPWQIQFEGARATKARRRASGKSYRPK